jgi:hypothetical protein
MLSQAEKTANILMDALNALGEGWHSRAELAAHLGKKRLNGAEATALDLLAAHGIIERQGVIGGEYQNTHGWQYRTKKTKGNE